MTYFANCKGYNIYAFSGHLFRSCRIEFLCFVFTFCFVETTVDLVHEQVKVNNGKQKIAGSNNAKVPAHKSRWGKLNRQSI